MLARPSVKTCALFPALMLAGALVLGLSSPGFAQTQEGDEALIDTISDPAIAEIVDATGSDLSPPDPLPAAVFLRIEFDEGSLGGGNSDARMVELYEFYDGRFYEPIWVGEDGANSKAVSMVGILMAAEDHGLDPTDYGAAFLATLVKAKSPQALADLEIRLSKAVLDYGRDLSVGRVEPSSINKDIAVYPEGPDASELLLGIVTSDDINAYLGILAPRSDNYQRLKSTLAAYRSISQQGGWTRIPAGELLKPGMSQPRIASLGKRLVEAGLLEPFALGQIQNQTYEGAVVEAVKIFQSRHGLEADGIVGPATLAALNTSVEQRISTMVLNMERRRWMTDFPGQTYVFVNLADFELKVVKNLKTILTAKVVVGKPYNRTPVFSKNMTYMVLNPFWHVPPSIAKSEFLPKLIADPGAMQAKNIKILSSWKANASEVDPWSVDWQSYKGRKMPFKFRQDPGSQNALGRIKFMFPNKFNVYLHDTPSKALFERNVRGFSFGCVRVQDPLELAKVLLAEDPNWSMARVNAALKTGRKRVVKLSSPIPVHITYLTAWVNKDGAVNFRDDIYNRDEALSLALRNTRQLIN